MHLDRLTGSSLPDRNLKCRWVVFDAVGTLITPNPSVAAVYHAIGERFGSRLALTDVGSRFRSTFRSSEHDGFPGGPLPSAPWSTNDVIEASRWRWIVGQVLDDVQDQEACFEQLWRHFALPTSWHCFDDVRETLRQLANSGYRLAIASNFDERLHEVCSAISDLALIEMRIVSSTVGFRKPAAQFYGAVARACDCDPQQILMVGDNFEYDVVAARAAGLQAIHIDRHQTRSETQGIRTLVELAELLL